MEAGYNTPTSYIPDDDSDDYMCMGIPYMGG